MLPRSGSYRFSEANWGPGGKNLDLGRNPFARITPELTGILLDKFSMLRQGSHSLGYWNVIGTVMQLRILMRQGIQS